MERILCSDCRHWEKHPGSTVGSCRLYPPLPTEGWPTTDYHDWCGQAVSRHDGEHRPPRQFKTEASSVRLE